MTGISKLGIFPAFSRDLRFFGTNFTISLLQETMNRDAHLNTVFSLISVPGVY